MRRLAALIILALTIAWPGPPAAAARAAPSPAYDASGNVVDNGTNLGGFAFTYDFSNQPVAVLGGASGAISNTYVFDANLKRAKYALSTATIYDVYSRVTGSVLYRNNVTNDFRFDLQAIGPLAVTFNRGAPDRFYHSDAQGSRLAFSNSAGVVGARERYAPFGESLLNGAGMGNFITYTGHMRDVDTGLTYMQARFYDPVIGRFLSTDPIGYQDQLNLYAYVANDPVNKVDPTGEQTAGIVQMINRINEALTPASQSGAPPATPLSPAPTPELVLPAGTVQVGVTGQVTVPGGFQVQGSLGVAISGAPDAAIVATGSAGPTSDVNGSVSVGGEVISSNAPSVMNLAGPGSAASYTGGNGVEGITGTGGRSDDGTVMTGGAAISIGVSREPSVGAARTETAVMPITPIDDERQRQ